MPQPKRITSSTQLLVEGRDAAGFFEAFLNHHKLEGFQIQDFGGNSELRGFLKALQATTDYNSETAAILIIRDAEKNHAGSFQSICSSLAQAGLPVARVPEEIVAGPPRVGVFLLPDSRTPGMLETLCMRAVAGDCVWPCIDQYFMCVQQTVVCPDNMDKARLQAFLASRKRPRYLIGHAAKAGYLNLDSDEYLPIRSFLAGF